MARGVTPEKSVVTSRQGSRGARCTLKTCSQVNTNMVDKVMKTVKRHPSTRAKTMYNATVEHLSFTDRTPPWASLSWRTKQWW
jgi:hypothetical protein